MWPRGGLDTCWRRQKQEEEAEEETSGVTPALATSTLWQLGSQNVLISWLPLFLEEKEMSLESPSTLSPPSWGDDDEMNKTNRLASAAGVFV